MNQYGALLPIDAKGQVGIGLGVGISTGTITLIPPTDEVTETGQTMVIDGLTFEFLLAPDTEAPSEMHWFIEELGALTAAENCCHTLHNTYTLRGAPIRDPQAWSRYLNETLDRWGRDPALPDGAFENLPEATLAAVVIAALIELVDVPALVRLYRFHTRGAGRVYAVAARPDFIAAVAALAGVLVFDTLPGLFIGIAVSLVLPLYRASRPHVAVLGRDPGADGAGAMAPATPTPSRRRASWSCGPRAASPSPTPTRSGTRYGPTRPTAPGRSCSTPRPSPPSTSRR